MKKDFFLNNHGFVDLHIHSTLSDGICTPNEIIKKVCKLNLKAFSLTDHDTIEGVKKIYELGTPKNIKFISGVEISASPPNIFKKSGAIHILGYGIDINNSELIRYLKNIQKERKNRSKKIIKKLDKLGIFIEEKEVIKESKNLVIGRPHFARVMIKKNIVKSFSEAFNFYLGNGRPAYVKKRKKTIKKVVEIIKNANGIPILAHPYLIGINNTNKFEKFIKLLVLTGIKGIEAIYPKHSKTLSSYYSKIASKIGILVTGGSDFHDNKDIFGHVFNKKKNSFYVPYKIFDDLLNSINK